MNVDQYVQLSKKAKEKKHLRTSIRNATFHLSNVH